MKIVIGIATFDDRQEQLVEAVKSLKNQTVQADEINIYNNSLEVTFGGEDLTDNGKFYFLQNYDEPVYYLSCDDDIFYPPNYIERTINAIERYKCIVTYHGRKLVGKNVDYYRGHKGFRCLGEVRETEIIDVAGTGVCGFRTDYYNPTEIYKSEYKRMADCVFSLEAAKQRKKIIILPHKEGWLRDLQAPYETSCHAKERRHPVNQIKHANEIYDLNYGV